MILMVQWRHCALGAILGTILGEQLYVIYDLKLPRLLGV